MKKWIVLAILFLANVCAAGEGYEILLKSRRFVPAEGISDAAKAKIESVPGRAHVLIQLESIPTNRRRKMLESRGVKLLSYIPENAWFASIPSDKAGEIAAFTTVRAITEILPEDKLSPHIRAGRFLEHRVKDGKVDLVVEFFKDVSLEEAELVVEKHNGAVVGRVESLNALVVVIKKEESANLANEEAVMWVEQELPLEELNDGARAAVGVDIVQGTPPDYELDGTDVDVLVYDGGLVDDTHDDFGDPSRVIFTEGGGSVSYHATHVAGTMLGDGTRSEYGINMGNDCISCSEWVNTPKYVKVRFSEIMQKGHKSYCEEKWGYEPLNGYDFILKQIGGCTWKYDKGDVVVFTAGDGNVWYPYAPGGSVIAVYFYNDSIGPDCSEGDFDNLCPDNDCECWGGGYATVSWEQPVEGGYLKWRGMAPAVDILSYYVSGGCPIYDPDNICLYNNSGQITDMEENFEEGIKRSEDGADIGTASVGAQPAKWTKETPPETNYCEYEGNYCAHARAIDAIIYNENNAFGKSIPITWAAGNERGYVECGTTYNTISPTSTAKNAIVVGATNSNDNSMTDFSSWGPTDDGRIKPDVVAPGCEVGNEEGIVSTIPVDTYGIKCGTSMATPVVAGSVALMLEDWRATHPTEDDPLPSTIKAILIQTATDLGNTGPDYKHGYGLIDVNEAVGLIEDDTANNNVILESSVQCYGSECFQVYAPYPGTSLKITLVWDDAPGEPGNAKALVNDLDLIVTDVLGRRKYPWVLNPNNPEAGAGKNQDHTNNVEQVVEVGCGPYGIKVYGYLVLEGPQKYSLVSSHKLVPMSCSSWPPSGGCKAPDSNNLFIVADCTDCAGGEADARFFR